MTIHVEAVGLTAAEVEDLTVLPIERALAGGGLVRAISTHGYAVVTVTVERDADLAQARSRISERLALATLPDDVHVHLGAPSADLDEIYVLRSDGSTMAELRTLQDWMLRPQLLSVGGVTDVISCGGAVPAIEVAVHAERLRARDVSIQDVLSTLDHFMDSAAGGYDIQSSAGDVIVRGGGARMDHLQAVQLEIGHGHVPVALRDVAEIRRSDEPAPCQAVLGDGTAVVTGLVQIDAATKVGDVRGRIDELRAELPQGVQLDWLGPSLRFRISTLPSDDTAMLQRLAESAARTAGHAEGVEGAIALIGGELDSTDRLPGEIDVLAALAPSGPPPSDSAILELLRAIPGVTVRRPDVSPSSRVRLELAGPDRASLAETAAELHRLAASADGVEVVVTIGAATLPRRSLSMDRGRMTAAGITARDVTDAVQLATDGREVGVWIEGAQRMPIEVRWADVGRDPQELGRIPLRASSGSWLMLQDVASLELDEAPLALLRTDGVPSMTVWIELADDARGAKAELRRRISDVKLGPRETVSISPGR